MSPAEEVDWALAGATVHRDAASPGSPEAIAMRDGRIIFVGPEEELRSRFGPAVPTRRARGGHVYPGFEDAHGHLHALGESLEQVRLDETRSLAEALTRVRGAAANLATTTWLVGGGWDESLWEEKRLPTAAELTEAAGGRPVVLTRRDHHAAWLSEPALAAIGYDKLGADPDGGRIVRDASGRPSGVLVDRAMSLALAALPAPAPEIVRRRLLRALKACVAAGLTAVHDMGVDARTLAVLREIDREHALPLRVYAALRDDPALWEAEFARGPQKAEGARRLTVRAVKLFADGALGSRGAALFADYDDDPGNRGLPLISGAELADRLTRATRAGFQCCVHAIGDRANRDVLDAFEALGKGPDGPALAGLRPRVEHAQVLSADDVPRFATVGVIASMQPVHAAADQRWAEERLGHERARLAYAWSSLHRARARLCFGSDFPVESFDPREGLLAARTRAPLGGEPQTAWFPEQQVDTATAVAAYTSGAAYAAFAEGERGRIAEGLWADLTIWDRDLSSEPDSLRAARVMATVVAGRIEHSAQPLPLG